MHLRRPKPLSSDISSPARRRPGGHAIILNRDCLHPLSILYRDQEADGHQLDWHPTRGRTGFRGGGQNIVWAPSRMILLYWSTM